MNHFCQEISESKPDFLNLVSSRCVELLPEVTARMPVEETVVPSSWPMMPVPFPQKHGRTGITLLRDSTPSSSWHQELKRNVILRRTHILSTQFELPEAMNSWILFFFYWEIAQQPKAVFPAHLRYRHSLDFHPHLNNDIWRGLV